MSVSTKIRLTICGGGNGAHTLAGLASAKQGVEVTVLDVFEDETERWSDGLAKHGFLVNAAGKGILAQHSAGRPFRVVKEAGEEIRESDIVVICVPAYAHRLYLELIAPLVKDSCIVVGMPGHYGFEFDCVKVLRENKKICSVMTLETLPWACRITTYGQEVRVQGTKDSDTALVVQRNQDSLPPVQTLQRILGDRPVLTEVDHVLVMTLMGMAIVHPPLMYSSWKDWDGKALDSPRLFYQGVTEQCVMYLSGVSEEVLTVCRAFSSRCPSLDFSKVCDVHGWLQHHYSDQIADDSSLLSALRTNKAFNGMVHPMKKQADGKFVPDFTYRYLREDIPFGLVGLRGLADVVKVSTPTIDTIITWAQEKLGKEYLVDGRLVGKDIGESRIPQNFGYFTAKALVAFPQ